MAAADSAPLPDAVTSTDATLARVPCATFVIAWSTFWVLMLTIAVQDHLRQGHADLWRPLLWEGSSFLVASLIVALHWPHLYRSDELLSRPWRWFAANLVWLPLASVGFVAAVYGLRHAIYAAMGLTYVHEPWPAVFRYEVLKFSLFYLLFVAILFGLRSYAAMGASRLRAERARTLLQQAQLLQLTQQLEPHFLFNALNTIAATVHADADRADALLTRLSALLRAATDLARRPEISLDEEVRLLEAYVAIMRERFADRVAVTFEIDPATRACRVPTLILQPLLENAFRHAVEPREAQTTIHVGARIEGEALHLDVRDDGGVLPAAPVFGVGLSNLKQRLALRYGARAALAIEAVPAGGVRAAIVLPCES